MSDPTKLLDADGVVYYVSGEEITTINGGSTGANPEKMERVIPAFRLSNGVGADWPGDVTNGPWVNVKAIVLPDADVILDGGAQIAIVRDFKTIASGGTQTLIPATASKFGRLIKLLVITGSASTTLTFAGTAMATQPTFLAQPGFSLQRDDAGHMVTSAVNTAMTLTASASGVSTSVLFSYALTLTA